MQRLLICFAVGLGLLFGTLGPTPASAYYRYGHHYGYRHYGYRHYGYRHYGYHHRYYRY